MCNRFALFQSKSEKDTFHIHIWSMYICAMTTQTPNECPVRKRVAKELKWAPSHLRDDALQEAWIAHLQGDDPLKAARNFLQRERRSRRRVARMLDQVRARFGVHGERL